MNCNETQTAQHDYLDGDLSPKNKHLFEKHIESCVSCRHEVEQERNTRELLSGLAYEVPSEEFENNVFKNVRNYYASEPIINKGNNKFVTGFVSAIAASILVWVTALVFFASNDSVQPRVISVAGTKVQTIRLMLDSENDVDKVTLSLGLPDNVRLKGYENQHQLVWETSLKKGDNILSLPVKAITAGQGFIIANVKYGNKSKQYRISIKTFKDNIRGDVYFNVINQSKLV